MSVGIGVNRRNGSAVRKECADLVAGQGVRTGKNPQSLVSACYGLTAWTIRSTGVDRSWRPVGPMYLSASSS
jgi:hypothetical protein